MKTKTYYRCLLSIILLCISFTLQAGDPHKLQITNSSTDSGVCYFRNGADIPVNGILYGIDDETAFVVKATEDIENAEILSEYIVDGKSYPVTAIKSSAFSNCTKLTDVSIPNTVTLIDAEAFKYCRSITSISIPESVISIGDSAFFCCTSLVAISIPESVKSIGDNSFKYCDSLTSISIPKGVTSIGDDIFEYCSSLAAVSIPEGVTSIGEYAFHGCSSLVVINIPEGVTTIGMGAFYGCSSISEVNIPESVTSIGGDAFSNCSSLAAINLPKNITRINSSTFSDCSSLAAINIPEGVTTIGVGAFDGCSSISVVNIPESVTSIGGDAFSNCSSLAAINLPKNITKINSGTFSNCSSLSSIIIPESVTSIGSRAFSNCSSIAAINIPKNVTIIDSDAFYNCSCLTSISIPESVMYIADGTLRGCSSLTMVNIPESVTSIGLSAFEGCLSLTTISIPESVTSIGSSAFQSCLSLTTISIPESVTTIGYQAFYNCSSLTSITIPENVTNIRESAFKGCSALTHLRYNAINCSSYGSYGENVFPSSISTLVIGDKVTNIPAGFLRGGSHIETINIPNSVTSIGSYAFSNISDLKSLTIGSGVTTISYDAFKDSKIIKTFWLGNTPPNGISNVNSIVNYVANDQYSIRNKTVYPFLSSKFIVDGTIYVPVSPSDRICDAVDCIYDAEISDIVISNTVSYKGIEMKVRNIGDYAFYGCSSITNLSIPNSITQIGQSAFQNCKALESVEIGTGLSSLPNHIFSGCSSLGSIVIPNNISYIEDYVFERCSSLTDVIIEDATSTISLGSNGSSALFVDCPLDKIFIGRGLSYRAYSGSGYSPFYRNTSLRSVEITDVETEIYDNEFYGCSNLKSFRIGNGVKTIGSWAFSGCSSLDYFSAGSQVETIGKEAFSDCTGLTSFYSFSILPPKCGSQALDDINKWECTLYVPIKSSEEYMAADQWKDFFFVNENDAVMVENISINVERLDGKTGDSFQLEADILPDNATRKTVEWTSSNSSIVKIDANGIVTFVKEGTATITASAKDGSGVSASIDVVVTVKDAELGDSNANGVVNIADAVNIANYAIGNEVEHFNEVASDVNQDGIITLADASATISLILEQPLKTNSMSKVRSSESALLKGVDQLLINDFSYKPGETITVKVDLANTIDYVALQADVVIPEGMSLLSANCGDRTYSSHSLGFKPIDDHTMRVVLFDMNNSVFAYNGDAILELVVKMNKATTEPIEIHNIIASDAQAHEYLLTSTSGSNIDVSGIGNVATDNINIAPASDGIDIYGAEGLEIAIYTVDGTVLNRYIASSEVENWKVVPGIYIVCAGNKTEKVMVK